MAPVIWGLNLGEIQWSKFKSGYMWNKDFHLRRTKFIVYQCALIFLVVSESLGTAALSDYLDAQDYVAGVDPAAYVYNNDYIGVASYNIFAGVFTAVIFGAAFFFDLFWPERRESRAVRLAWKVCGVLAVLFTCASAFALTVVTATHCGYISGVEPAYGRQILAQYQKDGGEPLCYRHFSRAIAAVVFVWPGFLSTVGSCILLFLSIDNTEKGPGPRSAHARQDAAAAEAQMSSEGEKQKDELGHDAQDAYPATTHPASAAHGAAETTLPATLGADETTMPSAPPAAESSVAQPVHAGGGAGTGA